MRFYNLIISDPTTGEIWKPSDLGFIKSAGGSTFTSFVGGMNDPAALNIEFDIPVTPYSDPQGQAGIKIWGIGVKMLSQIADLNGQNFQLFGGMRAGLPLATAAASQAGLLVQGEIYQAYANWRGTEMTLDLIVQPAGLKPSTGVAFVWRAGTSLATALAATLSQAFPKYAQNINIAPGLVRSDDQIGTYESLTQFAQYLQEMTNELGTSVHGQHYPGVLITILGGTIFVYDTKGPVNSKLTQIAFENLIGQPTWVDPGTVNFACVLRADIAVGNQIQFPAQIVAPYALTASAAAVPGAPASWKSIFQGIFTVTEVHYFAHYRQADGDSWVTTFSAVPVPASLALTSIKKVG